jgi:hypothetical protein
MPYRYKVNEIYQQLKLDKERDMKMFTVTITVSDIYTGRKFEILSEALALHEMDARAITLNSLDDDLLAGANILTIDIVQNMDGFRCIHVKPI